MAKLPPMHCTWWRLYLHTYKCSQIIFLHEHHSISPQRGDLPQQRGSICCKEKTADPRRRHYAHANLRAGPQCLWKSGRRKHRMNIDVDATEVIMSVLDECSPSQAGLARIFKFMQSSYNNITSWGSKNDMSEICIHMVLGKHIPRNRCRMLCRFAHKHTHTHTHTETHTCYVSKCRLKKCSYQMQTLTYKNRDTI